LLSGCGADVPGPGKTRVDVDTPELRELKAQAGIEDCAEGPGGGELPALTLPCLGGGPDVDLSTLRGPMMVNLWGSYCGPCRTEMPVLQEFHEAYGDQVTVLGVDYKETYPAAAIELAANSGTSYPSLADPCGELDRTDLVLQGLPVFVFVKADGSTSRVAGGKETVAEIVEMVEAQLDMELTDGN
jgi:thiol-disulfide isomerase/thioredoxin